ncbi:hypothetical protein, partial [Stenotrophomonas maltophilia]
DVVLDCWARMEEMIEISGLLPDATPACVERLDRAMATTGADEPEADFAELIARRDELLALARPA